MKYEDKPVHSVKIGFDGRMEDLPLGLGYGDR